eukprot:TRINITY_DN2508_c0_g2_i1.p1 TRINITY_DN2508_c0_g2~~TRINITY_DN2508_c0_g2_i1.p1  ORF type:complete len:4712 (+),score=1115.65 TRINITY_DN2508_c0_g2_i1:676-14136(+)
MADGSVLFPSLAYTIVIPDGQPGLHRRLTLRSAGAQQCSYDIFVRPGRAKTCVLRPPYDPAYPTGEVFSVSVGLKDEYGGTVGNEEDTTCMFVSEIPCSKSERPSSPAAPSSEYNAESLLVTLEKLKKDKLALGIGAQRVRGSPVLVALNTLQVVWPPQQDGAYSSWEGTADDAEAVLNGQLCPFLYAGNGTWGAAPCDDTAPRLCSTAGPCIGGDLENLGAVAVIEAMATPETPEPFGTTHLHGTSVAVARGGRLRFPALRYLRSSRGQDFRYTVWDGSLNQVCTGAFTVVVPPSRPTELRVKAWAHTPAPDGAVLLDCAPHDQFSAELVALDTFGNKCDWSDPSLAWSTSAIVGSVTLRLVQGFGTIHGGGLSRQLEAGKVTFGGMSFTGVGEALFEIVAPDWEVANPLGRYPPRFTFEFRSSLPAAVTAKVAGGEPGAVVTAGVPFSLTVSIKDRYGNIVQDPSRLGVLYLGTFYERRFVSSTHVVVAPSDSTLEGKWTAVQGPAEGSIGGGVVAVEATYTGTAFPLVGVANISEVIFAPPSGAASVALPFTHVYCGAIRTAVDWVVVVNHGEPVNLKVQRVDTGVVRSAPFAFGAMFKVSDEYGNTAADRERFPLVCELRLGPTVVQANKTCSTPAFTYTEITADLKTCAQRCAESTVLDNCVTFAHSSTTCLLSTNDTSACTAWADSNHTTYASTGGLVVPSAAPDPSTGKRPDATVVVPRLAMHTATGDVPTTAGTVWFRSGFAYSGTASSFRLTGLCRRTDADRVETGPSVLAAATDSISALGTALVVVEQPAAGSCPHRLSTQLYLKFRVRLVTARGERLDSGYPILNTADNSWTNRVDVTYFVQGTSVDDPVKGPYQCEYPVNRENSNSEGNDDTICAVTPTTGKINGGIMFSATGFASVVAPDPLVVVSGCAVDLLFVTEPPSVVQVNQEFVVVVAVKDTYGNYGGDDIALSISLALQSSPVADTALQSPLLDLSANAAVVYGRTAAGLARFSSLSINHPSQFKLMTRFVEYGTACDRTECPGTIPVAVQSSEVVATPGPPRQCAFAGFPREMVAGPEGAVSTYRVQLQDEWGHGVMSSGEARKVGLVLARGSQELQKAVGRHNPLLTPASIPATSLLGCPSIPGFHDKTAVCVTVLAPGSSLPRASDQNAFTIEFWGKLTSLEPDAEPSLLAFNRQLSWRVDWRGSGQSNGSHWIVLEVPPGNLVAEAEITASWMTGWHHFAARFEGPRNTPVSGAAGIGLAEILIDKQLVSGAKPAGSPWLDLVEAPAAPPFLVMAPAPGIVIYDWRLYGAQLKNSLLAMSPPGTTGAIATTLLQLRIRGEAFGSALEGRISVEPEGALAEPVGSLTLSHDTPLLSTQGSLEEFYEVPATCAGLPSALCGMSYAVTFTSLWYSLSPDTIRVGCYSVGLKGGITDDIPVRPGWPYRLSCGNAPERGGAGEPWRSSVGLVDEVGNSVNCDAAFPLDIDATEDTTVVTQLSPFGRTQERVWDCRSASATVAVDGTPYQHFRSAAQSPFQNDPAVAHFEPTYRSAPWPALPNADAEAGPAPDGQTRPIGRWGINPAEAGPSAEGWNNAEGGRDDLPAFQGLWLAVANGSGGLYYGGGPIDPFEGRAYFFPTVTIGVLSGNDLRAQMVYYTARDGSRVVAGQRYVLSARVSYVPLESGQPTRDSAIVEVEYRNENDVPIKALRGSPDRLASQYPAWGEIRLEHAAPRGVRYAVIRIVCLKNDVVGAAELRAGAPCRAAFDAISLSVHGVQGVGLRFSTKAHRFDGTKIPDVLCPPTLVSPSLKTCSGGGTPVCPSGEAPCYTCNSLCSGGGTPQCLPRSLCSPSTCSFHGDCVESPGAAAQMQLLQMSWPAVCIRDSSTLCCSGRSKAELGTEFARMCGNRFCALVPSPCKCFDDSVRGHWAGKNCDRCKEGFSGRGCVSKGCPVGDNNRVCSGHGVCRGDGKCVCFGEDQTVLVPGEAMVWNGSYFLRAPLKTTVTETVGIETVSTPRWAAVPEKRSEYRSCEHAALAYRWPDPDKPGGTPLSIGRPPDGIYNLLPSCTAFTCSSGSCSCTRTDAGTPSARFCRFFAGSTAGILPAMLVGGAWRGNARASGLSEMVVAGDHTAGTADFRPLQQISAGTGSGTDPLNPAKEGTQANVAPELGPQWAHLGDADGTNVGGTFWKPVHHRDTTNRRGMVVLSSRDGNFWVALWESEFRSALASALSSPAVPAVIATVDSSTGIYRGDQVCVYHTRGAGSGVNFLGVFTECRVADDPTGQSWPLWFGEGPWHADGGTAVAQSARIYVVDMPTTTGGVMEYGQGSLPAGIHTSLITPASYGFRVSDCCEGQQTWEDWRLRKWVVRTGGSSTPPRYGDGATVTARFESVNGIPSTAAELLGLHVMVVARASEDVDVRVQLRISSGQMGVRRAGSSISTGGLNAVFTPGTTSLTGGGNGWKTFFAPYFTSFSHMSVGHVRGLSLTADFAPAAGAPASADLEVAAIVLFAHWRRTPVAQTVLFSTLLRTTETQRPMMLMRMADADGRTAMALELNRGLNGQVQPRSVLVKVMDSAGETASAVAKDVDKLFSGAWFRVCVHVDVPSAKIDIGECYSGGNKLAVPTIEKLPVSAPVSLHGEPSLELLSPLYMREGLTIGADIATRSPQALFAGMLRMPQLWVDGTLVLELLMGGAPGTTDTARAGPLTHWQLSLQATEGWTTAALDAPPQGWSAYETANSLPAGTADHFKSTLVPTNHESELTVAPVQLPQRGFWGGTTCGRCARGYHGGSCGLPACTSNAECRAARCYNESLASCVGGVSSGYCVTDQLSPFFGRCLCADGYVGERCQRCAPPPYQPSFATVQAIAANGSTIPQRMLVCSTAQLCPATCSPGGRWVSGEYFDANGATPSANCGLTAPTPAPASAPSAGVEFLLQSLTAAQSNLNDTHAFCAPPPAAVAVDICGCPLQASAVCDAGASGSQCCPSFTDVRHTPVEVDCKGYPPQYMQCPDNDPCGVTPVPPPVCREGTAGVRHFSELRCMLAAVSHCVNSSQVLFAAAQRLGISTVSDVRYATEALFNAECPSACKQAEDLVIRFANTGSTLVASPRCPPCSTEVVQSVWVNCRREVIDVHMYELVMKEDFCGCVSPPIPMCDPLTTINTTLANGRPRVSASIGTDRLFCRTDTNGNPVCPDWNEILGAHIQIDCGGWPAPQLAQLPCAKEGFDPCGCPFPVFRCKPGTEGICTDGVCPQWDPLPAIDCKNARPPSLFAGAPHPCGCEPPPKPRCMPGTEWPHCPQLTSPGQDNPIDCKGRPAPPIGNTQWAPGKPRHRGNLACGCEEQVASALRCMTGSDCPIRRPCPSGMSKAPGGAFFTNPCPVPTLQLVECAGGRAPLAPDVHECECPATPMYRCIGGDGCLGDERKCVPYACGTSRFVGAAPADVCRTTCQLNEHCAPEHRCVASECIPRGPPMPERSDCSGDPSVCWPYGCNTETSECFKGCWNDHHCTSDAECIRAVSGDDEDEDEEGQLFQEVEETNACACTSCEAQEDASGTCVVRRAPALGACTGQKQCGGYACGKNNTQTAFSSATRCRTSCGVDAHCAGSYWCNQGACVRGNRHPNRLACAQRDQDWCSPYVCGAALALHPLPDAVCRAHCDHDYHCARLHRCEGTVCVPTGELPAPTARCTSQSSAGCITLFIPHGGAWDAGEALTTAHTPPPAATPPRGKRCKKDRECRPYLCAAAAVAGGSRECRPICESTEECQEGWKCLQRRCIRLRSLGSTCTGPRQCASGHCVGNVCCNTDCSGTCRTCSQGGVCQLAPSGADGGCGRCRLCAVMNTATGVDGVCVDAPVGGDPLGDCGDHGRCGSNGTCVCTRSDEAGHWAGEACDRCADGYSGELCQDEDTPYQPPVLREAGDPQQTLPREFRNESRAVQWPSRVLDFSTQSRPRSVLGLIGPPDATTYYRSHYPDRELKAWEPLQKVCDSATSECTNEEWSQTLQYVVVEFAEAVFIDQVWIAESHYPGSAIAIYAQAALDGAAASPGGASPVVSVGANGVVSQKSNRTKGEERRQFADPSEKVPNPELSQLADAAKAAAEGGTAEAEAARDTANATAGNATGGNTDQQALNAAARRLALSNVSSSLSLNENNGSFTLLWSRPAPRYLSGHRPYARYYAPPESSVQKMKVTVTQDATTGATTTVRQKSKVLKVVFDPAGAGGRVQIDSIAVVGFAREVLAAAGNCGAAVTRDVVNATGGVAGSRTLYCSGHGRCGVVGCVCNGGWDGSACDRCSYGRTGTDCEQMWPGAPKQVDVPQLCGLASFEDLNDYNADELLQRWRTNLHSYEKSPSIPARHFATQLQSPLYELGRRTHVRLIIGLFIKDISDHLNSGVLVRCAREQKPGDITVARTAAQALQAGEKVVYVARPPYLSGYNLIGLGRGETSHGVDVTFPWDHSELVVEVQVWSPDITSGVGSGSHRVAITTMEIRTCTYPSLQSGNNRPGEPA